MRSAPSGFVCTSDEMACSVLKRKCGCNSASSVRSRACDEPGLELRLLDRARLRLPAVVQRVAEAQRRRVGHQRVVESARKYWRCTNDVQGTAGNLFADSQSISRVPIMQAQWTTE